MKKINTKQLFHSFISALKRQDPINLALFVIVVIFIISRITSIHDQSDMMLTEVTTESSQTHSNSIESSHIQSTSKKEETSENTTSKVVDKSVASTTESTSESTTESTTETERETRMAYSKETGKYYTIEEFSRLDIEELMTFSGVGEVTAQAIYTFIQQKGTLSNFDELLEVKGIGEKKLIKLMNP